MAEYVCNVQTWGSSPQYSQGDVIPEDCPYDVEAAAKSGKVVTTEEYKKAHPDWDPEKVEKEEAFRKANPGRDIPTAADLPDVEAEKKMYEEAAKEAEGAKPVAVQPPSDPSSPPGSTGASGTSTRRTSSS